MCGLPLPSNDGEARFNVSQSFLPHGSGLAFGYAGGAFFHEKDFHCGEDDFDIFDQAGSGYIHEIHQEFVIGGGVVLAIDLGIAGKAAFTLKAEGPFGDVFFILGRDFRTFRPGTYNGHVSLEDIQKLGELVKADGPDNAPHFCNAGIVFPCGKAGHAVFFSIHAHASEFQYVKLFPILGQPPLAVEDAAAVGSLDGNSSNNHERRKYNYSDKGENNVHEPFEEKILRCRIVTMNHEHGQMEKVYLLCTAHDDIPYPGNDITGDVMGQAVFHNDISFMAVETADENDASIFNNRRGYVSYNVFGQDNIGHFEMGIHATALHDMIHVHAIFIAYQYCRHRRMGMEIPAVCSDGPSDYDETLYYKSPYQGKGIHEMTVYHGHHYIEKTIGDENGQCLAVYQIWYPEKVDGIAAIESGNQVIDDKEETYHHIIAQIIKGIGHFVSIVQSPGQGKYRSQQEQVKELHDADVQSLVCIAV